MENVKLLWFILWISFASALEPEKAISNLWFRFEDENHAMENENLWKVSARIGTNLTIPCQMAYNLTFFAWFFCESDCVSTKSWRIVVKLDNGSKTFLHPEKFGLDKDGALILKDVQPSNDNNWVRCYYKERLVKMDHRTTIIRIAEEAPTITLKSVKDHVVFEGMSLLLDCVAKGYPVPWVAWIWNDQVLQNRTDGPTYLLRRRVTMEKAGNYTCVAGNSIGITSFSYHVTVKKDGSTPETKAPPGIYSPAERTTVESKITSGAPPTAERTTVESKITSGAPPTDSNSKSHHKSSSTLIVGLVVGIILGVFVVVGLVVLGKRYRQKQLRRKVYVSYEGELAGASENRNQEDEL